MKVSLNKSESVTVTIRSRGGGQIWIRAYGERSPADVLELCHSQFRGRYRQALVDHAHWMIVSSNKKTYRALISWPGSTR